VCRGLMEVWTLGMYAGGGSSAPVAPLFLQRFSTKCLQFRFLSLVSLLVRIYYLHPLSFAGLAWDVSKARNLLTVVILFTTFPHLAGGESAVGTPVSSAVALANCF
jgi:hypothetical protein